MSKSLLHFLPLVLAMASPAAADAAKAAPAAATHAFAHRFVPPFPFLQVTSGESVTASGNYSNIVIEAGGTVTLTGTTTVSSNVIVNTGGTLITNCFVLNGTANFILDSGATLQICDANGISASGATGAVQSTGTRSFSSDAKYVYNGLSSQATGAGLPATVKEVEINVGGTLTLTNPTTVTSLINILAGTLNTGNRLTLESTAAGTASLITPDATGSYLNGTYTVKRYISPAINGGTGYRHVAFPVTANWSDVSTPGTTPVFNPLYNDLPFADRGSIVPFPTVFAHSPMHGASYNSFSEGWSAVDAQFEPVIPYVGYNMQLLGGVAISASGNYYHGNEPLALGPIFNMPANAYALMSNTWAAPVLWSQVSRQDIAPVYYMAQSTGQYSGRYASYVAGTGISVNGGTDTIPSGAGYFIQSTGTAAILTMPGSTRVRAASARPVYRQAAQPLARFELMNGTVGDESVIHFHANATPGFDNDYDANRMPGGMALYTHNSGKYYSINSNPESFLTDGAAHTFALGYTAQSTGQHTIKLKEVSALDGQVITLIDNQLNTRAIMNAGDVYTFQAAAGSNLTRFVIQMGGQATSAKASILSGLSVFPNPAKDRLEVSGLGQGASLMLINAVGQTVRTATVDYSTSLDLNDLAAGVYTLRIAQDGQTVTQKVVKQ